MQPVLIFLRNPKVQKVMLGLLLVLADMISTELGVKKRRS